MTIGSVAQSGKKRRVFDCFPFFNELDLLEIRLHELDPVVDRFVITESATTFSGRPKPLHFAQNRARFAEFSDRIAHIVVDMSGMRGASGWERRKRQCDALVQGLEDAAGDDIVLLSDVDEIVMADSVRGLLTAPPRPHEVVCLELRMCNYFVNLESTSRWIRSGPRAARRADIRTMEGLRKVRGPSGRPVQDLARAISASIEMRSLVFRRLVRDAGWHFSYLGGIPAIEEKLRSYAWHNKVPDDVMNAGKLAARIAEGRPVRYDDSGHRLIYREIDDTYPAYLRNNRTKFAHLIAPGTAYAADAAPPL